MTEGPPSGLRRDDRREKTSLQKHLNSFLALFRLRETGRVIKTYESGLIGTVRKFSSLIKIGIFRRLLSTKVLRLRRITGPSVESERNCIGVWPGRKGRWTKYSFWDNRQNSFLGTGLRDRCTSACTTSHGTYGCTAVSTDLARRDPSTYGRPRPRLIIGVGP